MSTAQIAHRRFPRLITAKTMPFVLLTPMILLFLIFKLYPYLASLWLSITSSTDGVQHFVGLANYSRLLADPLFWRALGNTALILIVQVPLMLALAIALAVALNSALLWFSAAFRLAYFVPIIIGLVAAGLLFGSLLNPEYGTVNWLLQSIGLGRVPWLSDPTWAKVAIVIIMTWHYTGYNAIIYLAQLQSIPGDLYEAAAVDGAGPMSRFWHVTVPGLRPAILLTVVMSTIGTLQLFDEPYVLTGGGPDNGTLTIGLYLYQNGFKFFDFSYASAIGFALVLLISLISMVQFAILGRKND